MQFPASEENSSPVPGDRAFRVKRLSSSHMDVEFEISSCREAVSSGQASELDLFDVLMCSNDPAHHSEAMEIALKNKDETWGRILLFRMHYNGVATDRDIKAALYWLYRGNPDFLYNNGIRIRYTINPEIFLHGDIVLCGSKEEVRSLFCICAQYGVRPDHYICPEQDLYEFFGTPCPDDGQKRCYIKFSTRKDISVGPGANFVYCPYDKKSGSKKQLLIPRVLAPEMKGVDIPLPVDPSELSLVKNSFIVDVRALNQNGYYVGAANSKALVALHLDQLEAVYKIGKAMYDKMCSKGGRFLITSFNPMGDNFNRLNKFEGMDFSDVTYVVSESARDLPLLLGSDGFVANRSDLRAIRVYLSMNHYEDARFRIAPRMPLYPGFFFHGDLDTSFLTGVARRTGESSLDLVGPVEDDCKEMVRTRLKVPPMVLLNPYGFTIKVRSGTENERTYQIISALADIFLEDGCMVYTNTPFPEQAELPGTKRYESDIVSFLAESSKFDLIVTVFTGFMEVAMYTDCNLVVLGFPEDSRYFMAEQIHHDNYWEYDVMNNDPEVLTSTIAEQFRDMRIDKPRLNKNRTERLMTIKEKAAIFAGEEVSFELVNVLHDSMSNDEIGPLLAENPKDLLLCSICARALERGVLIDADPLGAIRWYRRADKLGSKWAKMKIIQIKRRMKHSP